MKSIIAFFVSLSLLGCSGEFPDDFTSGNPEWDEDTDTRNDKKGKDTEDWDPAGADTDPILDPDFEIDTETPTDLEIDTGSNDTAISDTNSDPAEDTGENQDSETDTITNNTACAQAAKDDPAVVCCPKKPPKDCQEDSWDWSPYDKSYGCCTQDLSLFVNCQRFTSWSLRTEDCAGLCGFTQGPGGIDPRLRCEPKAGFDCKNPISIDTFPSDWSDIWSNYGNSFVPTNDCGDGDLDIWFRILVEAGKEVEIQETSNSKVVIRFVRTCDNTDCIGYAEKKPETMVLRNKGSSDIYLLLVVTRRDRSIGLSLRFKH